MEIETYVTEDEYVDYVIHTVSRNPVYTRSIWIRRFVVPVLFVLIAALVGVLAGGPWGLPGSVASPVILMAFAVLPSIAWLLFYPQWMNQLLARNTRGSLQGARNYLLIGHFVIRLDEDGVHTRGVHHQTHIDWAAVQSVDCTDRGVYLFVGRSQAVIIPRAAFSSDEQARAFIVFAEARRPRHVTDK